MALLSTLCCSRSPLLRPVPSFKITERVNTTRLLCHVPWLDPYLAVSSSRMGANSSCRWRIAAVTSSACFDEIDFPSGQYIGSPWSCFPPLGRPKISRNDGCRSKSSRWVRSMLMAVSNDGLVAYVFFFNLKLSFSESFPPSIKSQKSKSK